MAKRTLKKVKRKPFTRKKTAKKHVKRDVKRNKGVKRTHKKQRGGSDLKSIILGILSEKYIPFLPSTAVIDDKQLVRDYLSSISAFTLLTIIGKNDKLER